MYRRKFGASAVLKMVKVKMCGLTSARDAEMVCNKGADFVGVIVKVNVPTPREISPEKAREILKNVSRHVHEVVVTMAESIEEVRDLEEEIEPDYFQIHSDLSQSQLQEIGEEIEGKIIGVISIPRNTESTEEIVTRARRIGNAADLLLLDTEGPGGGTGKVHDWDTSLEIKNSLSTPLILAGGLTPSNVDKAIREVDPYAVDVASGVESEPGKKDPQLVGKFFDRVGG